MFEVQDRLALEQTVEQSCVNGHYTGFVMRQGTTTPRPCDPSVPALASWSPHCYSTSDLGEVPTVPSSVFTL